MSCRQKVARPSTTNLMIWLWLHSHRSHITQCPYHAITSTREVSRWPANWFRWSQGFFVLTRTPLHSMWSMFHLYHCCIMCNVICTNTVRHPQIKFNTVMRTKQHMGHDFIKFSEHPCTTAVYNTNQIRPLYNPNPFSFYLIESLHATVQSLSTRK